MRAPGQVVPGHSRGCSTGDTGTDGGWRTSHSDSAVELERFNGVEGTRRGVPARRRPAVSETLIRPHTSTHQTRDRAHRRSPSRALGSGRRSIAIVVCSVAYDQSSIGAVTRIRWSPPGRPGGVPSRSIRTARRRRFVRFLTTAVPTVRGIANAKRGRWLVSGRTTSRIGPRPRRVPSARSRANARWPASRSITPTSGAALLTTRTEDGTAASGAHP